jgi:hypothetical protein
MISVALAAAALVALSASFPVVRFSRWRWLSPWTAACVMTAAVLLVASGAADGRWYICALGAAVAIVQAWVARLTARARRRITKALTGMGGDCGW